jgi:hypothetical protein
VAAVAAPARATAAAPQAKPVAAPKPIAAPSRGGTATVAAPASADPNADVLDMMR